LHKKQKSNVILFHSRDGLHIIQLSNGRTICDIPLRPKRLYADLDKDGKIDELQVATNERTSKDSTGSSNNNSNKKDSITQASQGRNSNPCHAILSSGIDKNQSEIFNVHLCQSLIKSINKQKWKDTSILDQLHTSFAPTMLMEGFDREDDGKPVYDLLFALNHGSLQRYDPNGILKWSRITHDLPTWGGDGDLSSSSENENALLGRVDFKDASSISSFVTAAIRPILFSGDNGMSIVSSGRGKILAGVSFPQHVISRPILVDIDGDSTTDVLIVTNDAVWGYIVNITLGGSTLIRIAIILLMIVFAIAILTHEFGQEQGRSERATDSN